MSHSNFQQSFSDIETLLHHRFNIITGELDYTEPHKIISALNLYIDTCESESLKNDAIDYISFITTKDEMELRKIENSLSELSINDELKDWKKDVLNYSKLTLLRKINSLITWLNSVSDTQYQLVQLNTTVDTSQFANALKQKPQHPLSKIWLAEPKISINQVIQKGIENGLWNENLELTSKKNSTYGSGKTLLASLSVALKGTAISSNYDYKVVGKAFCTTFNIEIKENVGDSYKAFSSGKPHIIKEFKRLFALK